MNHKIYIVLLSVMCYLVLNGCAGGDSEVNNNAPEQITPTGPPITDANRALEVKDISGVWEFNVDIEGIDGEVFGVDHLYFVISDDGTFNEYDYLGDSLASKEGRFQNCYELRSTQKLEKIEEGGFEVFVSLGPDITISTVTNYDIEDGMLVAAYSPFLTDCKCEKPLIYGSRSQVLESEILTMMCELDR